MATEMSTRIEYELNRLNSLYPGYEFTATFKKDLSILDPKAIVKQLVSELKLNFDKYKFSLARNTYGSLAIIQLTCKPESYDIAWYQNDDVGYIADMDFYAIEKFIKSFEDFADAAMTVHSYVEGRRKCSFEINY